MLKDYSASQEIAGTFSLPPGTKSFVYNAICYVKDNYDGITKVTTSFDIFETMKTSGLNIYDIILSADCENPNLTGLEYAYRAEILDSLVTVPKNIQTMSFRSKIGLDGNFSF